MDAAFSQHPLMAPADLYYPEGRMRAGLRFIRRCPQGTLAPFLLYLFVFAENTLLEDMLICRLSVRRRSKAVNGPAPPAAPPHMAWSLASVFACGQLVVMITMETQQIRISRQSAGQG